MFNQPIKPRTIVISAIILLIGITVAIIATQIWKATNPITIDKVPSDAKLFISGKEVWGDRTNLANGTYKVRAEKSG